MKKERNVFLLICSLLLVAACLFSVFAGLSGLKDVMAIKEYKTNDKDEGLANIQTLIDGVNQLKDNESAYLSGVDTYTAGLASYAAGKQKLADAAQQLAAGEASYAAYQQTLAEGQATYDAGKATLDANTDAYNQGKTKLTLVEPIYTIAKATGIDPLNIVGQYEDGQAQIKQYEDGQAQLADGANSLANGKAALAEGKQTLLDGYSQYNAGVDSLNNGAAQLASGAAQLSVFEDGEDQVAAGLDTLLATPAIYAHDGKTVVVKSVADRLGSNYSYWALNDDGSVKQVRGHNYLNMDACLQAAQAGTDFINDQGDSVAPELTGRAYLYMAMFAVCLIGVISSIIGANAAYVPRRLERAAFFGAATSILALGANVYGLMGGYTGYTYPLKDGTYSGTLQFMALVLLAGIALIFTVAAFSALSQHRDAEAAAAAADLSDDTLLPDDGAAEAAPAVDAMATEAGDTVTVAAEDTSMDAAAEAPSAAAAEAPSAAAGSDKLHKLEHEEAELKQMLASLTSKINDLKQQET